MSEFKVKLFNIVMNKETDFIMRYKWHMVPGGIDKSEGGDY